MAKWSSALFSDIRGKLADQVVFTNWKGRASMRAYVKPANPKTNPQLAVRDMMTQAVAMGQGIMATPAHKTAWNSAALASQLSGFNLFTKNCTGSPIAPDDYSAAAITKVSGAGLKIPRSDVTVIVDVSGTFTVYTPSAVGGTAPAYEILIADLSPAYTPASGDKIYLGDNRVYKDTATQAEIAAQCTSHYTPDKTNGVTVEAILTA